MPLAKWAREHYYYWMRVYLIEKSYEQNKFAHKIIDGLFVPLIPPSSLGDSFKQEAATRVVARMTERGLEAFNVLLKDAWQRCMAFLPFCDNPATVVFHNFVNTEYFAWMEKALEGTGGCEIVPKVLPEEGATLVEVEERRHLLSKVSVQDTANAESMVVEKWDALLQQAGPSARTSVSKELSVRFWNANYYPVLKEVYLGVFFLRI